MLRSDPTLSSIAELLQSQLIRVVFQPIVELRSREIVAHEALARGPRGSMLESPAALFTAAQAEGLTAELDAACMRAALSEAERQGLGTVFVNAEPETFRGPAASAPEGLQVVLEVTERGVADDPAPLLSAVQRVRDHGWAVAIDDVGVDWRSLAMLPVLAPSIIKLDRSILVSGPSRAHSRMLRAARAHVDRRGGTLLAEGIEDDEHAQRAIGFGATLGQGFLFGRGEPVARPAGASLTFPREPALVASRLTPFEMLERDGIPTAIGAKRELLPMSRDIELSAAEQREPSILLGTFQSDEYFTAATRERYASLARGAALVAVFGHRVTSAPAGVTPVDLGRHEPLVDEWIVIAVGPHQTSGLISRDLGDEGPDLDRRFAYALLSDREIIERAARSLMLRIGGVDPDATPVAGNRRAQSSSR